MFFPRGETFVTQEKIGILAKPFETPRYHAGAVRLCAHARVSDSRNCREISKSEGLRAYACVKF